MGLTEKILLLALGLLLIILISVGTLNRSDKLKQLKQKYEDALQGSNRGQAIEAGKEYYRYLRGTELTIEDERAILKDVSSMPDAE